MSIEDSKLEKLQNNGQIIKNKGYFLTDLVWKNIIGFSILHAGLFYGTYLILTLQTSMKTFIWMWIMLYFSTEGVTLGAHRMWAHRSYKGTPALKIILLIAETVAGQNCIWIWARDHRLHHKHSDTNADPHNSKRGFFFCHMGWLMMRKHPDVIEKGKSIDMSDLTADPYVMFQMKYYYYLYFIFAFFLPMAIPVYFWGETWKNGLFLGYFWRYAMALHGTWCVNSVAHFFGTKPYTKEIVPVESVFVATISLGEGWHNYHHTFPWDYNAGEFGKYLNATGKIIRWLAKHGYAYDLKSATPEMVAYRIAKKGDGTHPQSTAKFKNEDSMDNFDITDIFGVNAAKYIKVG